MGGETSIPEGCAFKYDCDGNCPCSENKPDKIHRRLNDCSFTVNDLEDFLQRNPDFVNKRGQKHTLLTIILRKEFCNNKWKSVVEVILKHDTSIKSNGFRLLNSCLANKRDNNESNNKRDNNESNNKRDNESNNKRDNESNNKRHVYERLRTQYNERYNESNKHDNEIKDKHDNESNDKRHVYERLITQDNERDNESNNKHDDNESNDKRHVYERLNTQDNERDDNNKRDNERYNAASSSSESSTSLQWIEFLVEKGLDINCCGKNGDNVFKLIANHIDDPKYKNIQTLRRLKELGADINNQCDAGKIALHLLCQDVIKYNDNSDPIDIYLELGADPNIQDVDSMTPLMMLVKHNQPIEKFEKLLLKGGDIDIFNHKTGENIFILAMSNVLMDSNSNFDTSIIAMNYLLRLLELKVDIDDVYTDGNNMLMEFINRIGKYRNNIPEFSQYIPLMVNIINKIAEFDDDIDIHHRNDSGKTVLHIMLDGDSVQPEIIQALTKICKVKKNINAHTYNGTSLFRYAVSKFKTSKDGVKMCFVKFLLDIPIKLVREDINGLTKACLDLKYMGQTAMYRTINIILTETLILYSAQKIAKANKNVE